MNKYGKNIIYVVGLIVIFMVGCNKKVEEFNIEDYKKIIDNKEYKYQKDINIKAVRNEDDAKSAAEKIWKDVFGKSAKEKKSYVVMRDKENSAWLVNSVIKYNTLGGTYWIIISDEGEVLAVWGDK